MHNVSVIYFCLGSMNETALAVERCAQGTTASGRLQVNRLQLRMLREITRLPRQVRPVYRCAHELEERLLQADHLHRGASGALQLLRAHQPFVFRRHRASATFCLTT